MPTTSRAILMAILLIPIADCIHAATALDSGASTPASPPNSISNLELTQKPDGMWTATFDYFYGGSPGATSISVQHLPNGDMHSYEPYVALKQGHRHVVFDLPHPGPGETTTTGVLVRMASGDNEIAAQHIERRMDWPDLAVVARAQWVASEASKADEELLAEAIFLIDRSSEPGLSDAKATLERLILKNPSEEQYFIELARIAMKQNWGSEGLHQAESLLKSALQLNANSENAKILMGYVYAHQGHHAKAEAMFADAAKSQPKNLWLWANWGEVLKMQGKIASAIAKYERVALIPRRRDSNDRAQLDAYRHLIPLYVAQDDLANAEALYEKRASEYGASNCFGLEHADFVLRYRGDYDRAIELTQALIGQRCPGLNARHVLGMAYYARWTASKRADRDHLLHQARVFLPTSAHTLYLLASNGGTAAAFEKLIEGGEDIDQKDNDNLTALARALQEKDLRAARRILASGADPATRIGYASIPVALASVMEGDIDAVRLLQEFGADYTRLSMDGITASDIARSLGDQALLEQLTAEQPVL